MSFLDRLEQLQYTSPSGATFTLRFQELERSGGKKAPVTEFPQKNAGAVQDLGNTTIRYPINCYITGRDYDLEADRFKAALGESGPGTIQHPRWGTIPALPVTWQQTENFVNGMGRAVFQIEFVQADDVQLTSPRTARKAATDANAAVDDADAAIQAGLEGTEVTDPGERAALKEQATKSLSTITDAFDQVTGVSDSVRQSINETVGSITREIDSLVQAPIDLAESLLRLYRLPADTATDILEKIDGYQTIFGQVSDQVTATTERYGELFGLIGAAQVQGIGIAASEAAVTGTTATRASAIQAVDALSTLAGDVFTTLEELNANDFASAWATRKAMTAALTALIDRSLDLPAERVHVTVGDITPIALAYKLYGETADIEAMTTRLISYNGLAGSEILLIPAGQEVRWYV